MAGEPLDSLRLALMQDVLPLGLAVVERARRGGPREVIAVFEAGESDALTRLRQEGEPAARQLRDNLDRLQPGLGNPVVKVSVRDVPEPPTDATALQDNRDAEPEAEDPAELQQALSRIAARLSLLESQLMTPASQPEGVENRRIG